MGAPEIGSVWHNAEPRHIRTRIRVIAVRDRDAIVVDLDYQRTRTVNLTRFRPHHDYRSGWVHDHDMPERDRPEFNRWLATRLAPGLDLHTLVTG